MASKDNAICKSIFKYGEGRAKRFTQKWAEIINRSEKNAIRSFGGERQ